MEDAKKADGIAAYHSGVILDNLISLGFKNIDKSPTIDSIFKKILHDRAELMVVFPESGINYWLKKNGYSLDTLIKTPVRIASYEMYIICSNDIPDKTIERWQNSLDNLKASGEFDRILKKYK